MEDFHLLDESVLILRIAGSSSSGLTVTLRLWYHPLRKPANGLVVRIYISKGEEHKRQ